jgi:hypothetical protein
MGAAHDFDQKVLFADDVHNGRNAITGLRETQP